MSCAAIHATGENDLSNHPYWADVYQAVQEIIRGQYGAPLSGDRASALAAALRAASPAANTGFTAREITVLVADLRGFTSFSERYPPSLVLEVLNEFLIEMSAVVTRHGGRIEKFMGDSVMALFGLPDAHDDDALRAVTCALEMQLALDALNDRRATAKTPKLYMGIGVSSGSAMAGVLGSELYSEHAVIGDDVNLASRIEAVSLRGQVLISDKTYALCRDAVVTGKPVSVYVKGKTQPVTIHEVTGIPALALEVRRKDMRASPRVQTKLPFTYYVVRDKIVASQPLQGVILDLGYHGAAASFAEEYPPHTEIKLSVNIPLVDSDASDVYARVIRTKRQDGRYLSGLEFTALSDEASAHIQQFVHYMLQTQPE